MFHAGITHAGLPGGGSSPCKSAFTCCAMLKLPQPKYSTKGVLSFLHEAYLPANGFIFSPSIKWAIPARGMCIISLKSRIRAIGLTTKSDKSTFGVTGHKALIPLIGTWTVRAIKKKTHSIGYSAEGITNILLSDVFPVKGWAVLRENLPVMATGFVVGVRRLFVLVKGDKAGKVKRLIRAKGAVQKESSAVCGIRAVLATSYTAIYNLSGKIRVNFSNSVKVTGKLFSKIYNTLFGAKGYIPKIAFIASVPKRFQDFVTNKRWFR